MIERWEAWFALYDSRDREGFVWVGLASLTVPASLAAESREGTSTTSTPADRPEAVGGRPSALQERFLAMTDTA